MVHSVFDTIRHPLTNKKLDIRSSQGQRILAKYVSIIKKQVGGNNDDVVKDTHILDLNDTIDYTINIHERDRQLRILSTITLEDRDILRQQLDKIGIIHKDIFSMWRLTALARDWLLNKEYIFNNIILGKLSNTSDDNVKLILEQDYKLPVKNIPNTDARDILKEILLKEYSLGMIASDLESINTNCDHFKTNLTQVNATTDTSAAQINSANTEDYYNCAKIQLNRVRNQRKNVY